MVSSIWGRLRQAFRDSPRASGEGLGLYTTNFTVSNARMKTIRASPYVAIKGIPDRIIIPLKVVTRTPDVTTARTGAYDVQLRWNISSSSRLSCTSDLDRTAMTGTTGGDRFGVEVTINNGQTGDLVGKDVILQNVDNAEYGSGSIDNEVTFHIFYSIIEA